MLQHILFAGGGTGGHVYMAVAIRAELLKRNAATEFLFVGTERGMEQRILPPLDFPLETIEISGMKNVGTKGALKSIFRLPASVLQSWRILRKFRPDIVVGLGGYSSGPVVAAAKVLRLPTMVIEPNVTPGFTNRSLARWVDAAAVAFPKTEEFFRGRGRLTGIPIRNRFHEIALRQEFGLPIKILVFGGSLGSHPLNKLVCAALPHMDAKQVRFVHQTGPDDFEDVRGCYVRQSFPGSVRPYIEDMPDQFAWADLVISRAGASTVAEIAAAGRPAVLVPFPQAADDHQRKNALTLQAHGAAVMLEQAGSTGEILAARISALAEDPQKLKSMAQSSRSLAQPDSTAKIIRLMSQIVEDRS
jgi:UDP-N-acetylglucosamine--N-acetylmuramyl-(pentapeptide) pyrophosphoryl-undecaprenol N-acetylglucosamine transferase